MFKLRKKLKKISVLNQMQLKQIKGGTDEQNNSEGIIIDDPGDMTYT